MSDSDDTTPLPPDLRFLKFLVTTLAGVMILGLLTITVLLVTRLGTPVPLPELPESVILPQGTTPAAVTFAQDWLVVVTDAGEILLYPRSGGAPVSRMPLP
ncbi:DUF6476 family protein [Pararhodobacter oceanensis]|uniref:Uncharacterized protein n=1 Tax=Pararhodobacter oceanensis TaxID=2172121 RepID=A0A2T8HX08_9RHOB|nr:DUF6476 family protein [Pararhodobacter oceanensis]PVH29892.1 hypothetical protein DDE20_07295 [Pararhodobacter oceanensis]